MNNARCSEDALSTVNNLSSVRSDPIQLSRFPVVLIADSLRYSVAIYTVVKFAAMYTVAMSVAIYTVAMFVEMYTVAMFVAIYTVAMFVAIYTVAMFSNVYSSYVCSDIYSSYGCNFSPHQVSSYSDKLRAGRRGDRGFDSQRRL